LLDGPSEAPEHSLDLALAHRVQGANLYYFPYRITGICTHPKLQGGAVSLGAFMEELCELRPRAQTDE
jgi:hypothetical protein